MLEVDHAEQLANEFSRWDYLYHYGGSDPFWSDGVNLNLVRNHIIYAKRQLEESVADGVFLQVYCRETPPEVEQNYMARADEIRKNAANTLKIYQSDKNYLWCKAHVSDLTLKESKQSCIENILGYVTGLEWAIAEDDLVTMRRHEHPERYSDSFERGAREIKTLFSAREAEPQISFITESDTGSDDYETEFDDEMEISL